MTLGELAVGRDGPSDRYYQRRRRRRRRLHKYNNIIVEIFNGLLYDMSVWSVFRMGNENRGEFSYSIRDVCYTRVTALRR